MMKTMLIGLLVFFVCIDFSFAQNHDYVKISIERSMTVKKLLTKYKLEKHQCNIAFFKNYNEIKGESFLFAKKTYVLPIKKVKFNGKNIRTTLDIDYNKAKRIENFNNSLTNARLKKSYKQNMVLWVPYHELECKTNFKDKSAEGQATKTSFIEEKTSTNKIETKGLHRRKKHIEPYFGSELNIESDELAGQVFYIKGGHGGPDPGAMAKVDGHQISEDEYAYDVALRLARNLIKKGALVYMITLDPDDGIREDTYLKMDNDEVHSDGSTIPLNQLKRLQKRVDIINSLYYFHKRYAKSQKFISIHVDSRKKRVRQDVFFYYRNNDKIGKNLAKNLWNTFNDKYEVHREDDYDGTYGSRDLFVLKNTLPPAVYVELGNIQNALDQNRILNPSNRQLLANWLFDGLTLE